MGMSSQKAMAAGRKRKVGLVREEKALNLRVGRNAVVAQLVEHWLPKPRVASSSLVCRSKKTPPGESESCSAVIFFYVFNFSLRRDELTIQNIYKNQ